MRKRDTLFFASATFLTILLGLSAMAIPTKPGVFQKAVNDRFMKIKMLEASALPGSFDIWKEGEKYKPVIHIETGAIYVVAWKDDHGEPFSATFILTDNGDLGAGHGFSGDFVPVANWYEVEE